MSSPEPGFALPVRHYCHQKSPAAVLILMTTAGTVERVRFCVNRRRKILVPEPHMTSLTREAARGHTDEPAKANYPPDSDTHQKQEERKSKRTRVLKKWKTNRHLNLFRLNSNGDWFSLPCFT